MMADIDNGDLLRTLREQSPTRCTYCGHDALKHIYKVGACRPGYVCPCPEFRSPGRTSSRRSSSLRGGLLAAARAGLAGLRVVLRAARAVPGRQAKER